MASGLTAGVVVFLCLVLVPVVSADDRDCLAYRDRADFYHHRKACRLFCCGTCEFRYCCSDTFKILTEDDQENCKAIISPAFETIDSSVPIVLVVCGVITVILILICCCVCPCCFIYKNCRKPQPVIATTRTTVTTSRPYPLQQASAVPSPAQGAPYPTYYHMPVQPGMGLGPMMYQGQQPAVHGPPPSYQEATFQPGHQMYPVQPNASSSSDFSAQPAYNPDFVPLSKTG
ncbi:protein shisa-5-like [Synchiropus splendidus]|uniref:protein shisa-5-like n=1 Tax=Synchiropus splendidus TaxID=270530 RepID=UPI00237DD1FA|nr:protein shisa-5-like [Synchiropus splendidus]